MSERSLDAYERIEGHTRRSVMEKCWSAGGGK